MLSARWRTSIRPPFSPPLIVLGTAALISLAAAQLAAAAPLAQTSAAADCSGPGAAARAMHRHAAAPPITTQKLDDRGEFAGRGLTLKGRTPLSLPVDSFVGVPIGDALLYSATVGGRSEIHLVDMSGDCDTIVAVVAGIARSAILDPDGGAVYVHSVTHPSRSDAGVTRYAMDGSEVTQVVPPLPDDARFGLTFATQLGLATDGTALFVQSCGVAQCRTRVLDLSSGLISTFDGDGQGPIIGLTPDHLVSYGACGGLPCTVLSLDRTTGETGMVVEQGWTATMGTDESGHPVVHVETAEGETEVAQ